MTPEWELLTEWVEIRIPSKDRRGDPIDPGLREQWVKKWKRFLFSPDGMYGQGSETTLKEGTWPRGGKAIFDPQTGDVQIIEERVDGLKIFCNRQQFADFEKKGTSLLVQMGLELNQDAVSYSDRAGLHTKSLTSVWKEQDGNENTSKTREGN